jgi:hypothetical protein
MNIKEMSGSIVAVAAVVSLAFGGYFYFEHRYALADELQKTNQRLEQKIQQDRVNAVQERMWKIEDRLQDQNRRPTDLEKDEIRKLQVEKDQIEKGLKEKR